MATHYYLVSGKSFEERDEPASVDEGSKDISWIHLVSPTPEEQESVLGAVGMSPRAVEMLMDQRPHPEVVVLDGTFASIMPVQVPGEWRREYLRYAVRRRTLVTMTEVEIPYLEEFRRRVVEQGAESATNPLSDLLMSCGRADKDALQAMRSRVDELERLLDDDPDAISFARIRELKRAILVCGNICEDQLFVLASSDSPAAHEIIPHTNEPVREAVLALVKYVDRSFDRLESRSRQLESQLQMIYQKRTEDRLRFLTVISAVFMPLTLIAGIYGMNFEVIPELDEPYAYQICIGLMVALAAGMLVWFYRRGWFTPTD
jgi:magnesium transporter